MSFVDTMRVQCRAGSGGDGCLSFRREKYVEFGGPDGGDGGKGGDVILVADGNLSTLMDLARHPHLTAEDGGNGKGSNKTGAGAEDLVVRVPVGTLVYDQGRLVADLARPGDRIIAARGGRGGRGNLSFKTHKNTAPRIAEKGEPGREVVLRLELKLLADVGLVGFPNAGKSSLLSRVSNARPKVAPYPFTTLSPHLGLVNHKGASFVLADIPGLIEGAYQGKGLGDEFLRHIERTRLLVHLIDPMGYGDCKPERSVGVIESELRRFSKSLAARPRALVVTKTDLPEAAGVLKRIKARFRRRRIFGVSSVSGNGVSELLDYVVGELSRMPKDPVTFQPPSRNGLAKVHKGFEVLREPDGLYRVAGGFVERMIAMANFAQPETVERIQKAMKRIGLDKALVRAGVRPGDTVRIGRMELEWRPAVKRMHARRKPLAKRKR